MADDSNASATKADAPAEVTPADNNDTKTDQMDIVDSNKDSNDNVAQNGDSSTTSKSVDESSKSKSDSSADKPPKSDRRSSSRDRRRDRDRRDRDRESSRRSDRDRDRRSRRSSRDRDRRDRPRDSRRSYRSRSRDRRRDRDRRDRDRDRDRDRRRDRDRDRDRRRDRDDRPREEEMDPAQKAELARQKEMATIERDQRTVFACQIHPKVDERDIFQFFSQAGTVTDVQLIRDIRTGKSKGLCYIEFELRDTVPIALAFSGQLLGGFPITVQVTQAEKNRAAAAAKAAAAASVHMNQMKLFISNLNPQVSDEDLRPVFEAFGPVDNVEVSDDLDQGARYGYVLYRKAADGQAALSQLNGLEILGRTIRVAHSDLNASLATHGPNFAAASDQSGQQQAAAQQPMTSMGMDPFAPQQTQQQTPSQPYQQQPQQQPFQQQEPPQQSVAELTGMNPNRVESDDTNQGMHMNSASRSLLMQKLGGGVMASEVPKIGAGTASLSTCCVLRNMFDPAEEEGDFESEIKEDVGAEVARHGELLHIHVDRFSQGHVYLKFRTARAAQATINALSGRWFAKKQIQASFFPESDYLAKFGV